LKLVFTCEHGGNDIPEKYFDIFNHGFEALNSHKGLDYGSLDLFNYCEDLSDFSVKNSMSRLLIEFNRSLHHPKLFSKYSASLSEKAKQLILKDYYKPYRNKVSKKISQYIEKGEEVVHLSFHSFTPVLNGVIRNTDIGILYDPSRISEKKYSHVLKEFLQLEDPDLHIRYNYPYLGKADGFTTALRREFPTLYNGIELEVNQKFCLNNKFPEPLKKTIFNALINIKKKSHNK
tara:strand:- start:77413 stop:78111 length:699 start_codon:yes stop_codon:yes gene_type:complete